jgi:signal transduction histidine kinase
VTGSPRPRLSPEQAEELRQLVHEAFSNILRHARASRVTVRLASTRRRLALEISDDGIGFDPQAFEAELEAGRSQGLPNLRRRAQLLGAELAVRSAPGQGTSLSLTMPLPGTGRRNDASSQARREG